jgi:hypothetical protein
MGLVQVADVVGALVTIRFVHRLESRQVERYARLVSPLSGPKGPAALPGGAPGAAVGEGPHCPSCGATYRSDDYRADAEHIYCSRCRAELPR